MTEITNTEILKTIEKIESELNALRVKIANNLSEMSNNSNETQTSTSEPKNALKHILYMLNLPDDEDMLINISKEVEKHNMSETEIKHLLESICKYRDKQTIGNIRGYILNSFRKFDRSKRK